MAHTDTTPQNKEKSHMASTRWRAFLLPASRLALFALPFVVLGFFTEEPVAVFFAAMAGFAISPFGIGFLVISGALMMWPPVLLVWQFISGTFKGGVAFGFKSAMAWEERNCFYTLHRVGFWITVVAFSCVMAKAIALTM